MSSVFPAGPDNTISEKPVGIPDPVDKVRLVSTPEPAPIVPPENENPRTVEVELL